MFLSIYIYITETFETPTIFHVNTIFFKKKNINLKKKRKKKHKRKGFSKTQTRYIHSAFSSLSLSILKPLYYSPRVPASHSFSGWKFLILRLYHQTRFSPQTLPVSFLFYSIILAIKYDLGFRFWFLPLPFSLPLLILKPINYSPRAPASHSFSGRKFLILRLYHQTRLSPQILPVSFLFCSII